MMRETRKPGETADSGRFLFTERNEEKKTKTRWLEKENLKCLIIFGWVQYSIFVCSEDAAFKNLGGNGKNDPWPLSLGPKESKKIKFQACPFASKKGSPA